MSLQQINAGKWNPHSAAGLARRAPKAGRLNGPWPLLVVVCLGVFPAAAQADPCGMVPPIYPGGNVPIARVGDQNTYVFYKDGVETFVIHPGFTGKVDEFGMLIPFPSVPAIRKVSDNIFPHVRAAIDPPEVVIDLRPRPDAAAAPAGAARKSDVGKLGLKLQRDEVRVIKEEAVGMYEVAVLEAGSAAALKKWMDEHGYVYPKGMDAACEDYVKLGWCFVAVKTKVGQKKGVDPKPGMRKVDSKLPAGATFDGHVQAMGFRFKVDRLVVPMRLSAFNEGKLDNIVYVLSDTPLRIESIPTGYVKRQVAGGQLLKNVTDPLPLRIIGGTEKDLRDRHKRNLKERRNPVPHNGAARDLFAADLLAVKQDRLSHPHEEKEKRLLAIGERLGLRGPEIDRLNEQALEEEREKIVKAALADLQGMTLTVIDGEFPRDLLAKENLTFAEYRMPARLNSPQSYDAKTKSPAPRREGILKHGELSRLDSDESPPTALGGTARIAGMIVALSCLLLGLVWITRRRGGKWLGTLLLFAGAGGAIAAVAMGAAPPAKGSGEASPRATTDDRQRTNSELIAQLKDPESAEASAKALIARGESAVPLLAREARKGDDSVVRGWAIVCLAEIGSEEAADQLTLIQIDRDQSDLVRTWAAAGRVHMADSTEDLLRLAEQIPQCPAIGRPIGMKLVAKLNAGKEKVSAEDLLGVTIKVPQLQQSLAPAVLALGSGPLVEAMTSAKDQNARRQAAAYLGTLAGQGEESVPQAVASAYDFDPKAKRVPWDGGPLFIPALDWKKDDARKLVGSLIAWYVWAEVNESGADRTGLQRQLHNNLRSLQLASAAGYQSPGFREVDVDEWLLVWGRAAGKDEIERILKEQNLADEPRYKRILERL